MNDLNAETQNGALRFQPQVEFDGMPHLDQQLLVNLRMERVTYLERHSRSHEIELTMQLPPTTNMLEQRMHGNEYKNKCNVDQCTGPQVVREGDVGQRSQWTERRYMIQKVERGQSHGHCRYKANDDIGNIFQ